MSKQRIGLEEVLSAIVAFPNGNIYTEKAHQNEMEKLRKELTKWTSK